MITADSAIIKKLLILFLVFAGLYYARDFLIPLSIGTVLATLFLPLCKWLENKRVPKGLAALICLLVFLFFIVVITMLLGFQISEMTNDIALTKQKTIEAIDRVQEYIFNHLGISAERQWRLIKDQQISFKSMIPVMAGSITFIAGNFILILAYIFLLLYYRDHIKKFILKLSSSQQEEMELVIHSATRISQQYLLGLTKMIICLWIMYSIGFSIIGVKNPFFFAVLCGLLEIIPFIGNITGTTITILVAASQGASLTMITGIVITYGIIQFIQGWLLEPLIVGTQVKINPLSTIIALVLGQLVWGIPGIFLAIPLIAMFKTICDHIESLKPYGFLIGKIETGKTEHGLIKKLINWNK